MSKPELVFQILKNIDDLASIMDNIDKKYSTGTDAYRLTQAKEMLPCAAKYEDGSWYRAEIRQTSGKMCLISFVDYGNEEWQHSDKVRDIFFTGKKT